MWEEEKESRIVRFFNHWIWASIGAAVVITMPMWMILFGWI